MKNILTAALALAASVCSALDPGVDAARRGSLASNHSVVTNVSAVRLVGPLADTPLVEGGRTNRLLTTASAGVRNPFALRYGLASSYLSYVGSSSRGLFFGDGLSFSSDGTDGTVSVDSAYLGGLGFAKAADVAAELSRKQGSLSPAQLAAADSGVTAAKVASYDAHVADGARHVTAAQKAEWSAKQDALTPAQTSAVDSGITAEELVHLHNHRVDRTVHINDEFLALNADRAYVDGKVGGVETAISGATNMAANAQQRLYGTSSFRRIRDFLYEADVDRLFPDFAEAWIASNYNPGVCTSFRTGDLHCRNYDWTYSDLATVVVRTEADVGRHAAIAVSGAVPGLTDAFCASGAQSDMYRVLPYRVVDGINDAGLAVSVNVVPGTHQGVRHTFPGAPVSVCAVAVVRHVLDSYATAAEAALALTNGTVDVWLPDPSASKYAYHWLLSDRSGSKVVELGNGTVWALDAEAMANFRLRGCSFNAVNRHVVASSVEQYGNGLERYDIAADGMPAATNAASAMSLLRSLRYTRFYTETSSPWYTELCGESPELTVTADRALFGPFLEQARNLYAYRTRESGTTWQTVHSAVYDLSSRKLTLSVQEEYGVSYEFSFPGGAGVSPEWLVQQGFVKESDIGPRLAPLEADVAAMKPEVAKVAGKQDALTPAQTNAVDSGVTQAKREGYDAHVADSGIHVTAAQKSAWTAKQDALTPAQTNAVDSGITQAKREGYDAHVADGAKHVTAAQKAEWSAKQDALTQAQADAVDSGITQAKRETYDGYGTLVSRLQAVKVDAADVYTKDEIELVVLRNLVQATITNHLSNLTWDDSYRVMWRKTADAGAFYERAYTNVNIIVTGGGQ